MKSTKARQLRNNPTDAERHLWRHLRLRQLDGHRFRRQQPLGPYIIDFVCLEQRLIIEVDGGQHSEQVGYDSHRSAWLAAQGFRVLRFWNNEVFQEVEAVKEVIGKALGERPPSFILPRKGNGMKLRNGCHCEERERRSNLLEKQRLLRCARNDTAA